MEVVPDAPDEVGGESGQLGRHIVSVRLHLGRVVGAILLPELSNL